MLRISKQVDYGILLLAHCTEGDRSRIHSTRDLAEQSGLPTPMVSKILKGLAREGILESYRGTKGGYSLAREASEISVAAIVRALEGPVRLVDCASDTIGPCRFRGQCRVVHPMKALANAVRDVLERTTLQQLITIPREAGGNGSSPDEGNGSSCPQDVDSTGEESTPDESCSWPSCKHKEAQ